MTDAVFAVPMVRFPFQSGGAAVHDEEVIKQGIPGRAGVNFFQFVLVVEISRIIKILGARGTAFDTGAALDTDPLDLRHIGGIDAAHGTSGGAQAAAAAESHVCLGLDLQNVDGRAWRSRGV